MLHTDASDYALGAVLSHVDDDGEERPICYASKTLDKHQRNYTVTEKECLAVVWATELWRTLLLGKEFVVETDHAALRQILMDKTSTGRLARWALKLQEFDFWVKYRKGEENGNADFLSRVQQAGDLYSIYGIKMEARKLTKDFSVYVIEEDPELSKECKDKSKSWITLFITELTQPQRAPEMQQALQPIQSGQLPLQNQENTVNRLFQPKKSQPNPVDGNLKQYSLQAQQNDEWCNQIRAVL